jgi:PAS domain S-box-containing protein
MIELMAASNVQRAGERLGSAPRDVLEALIASVADAIYVVDPDGRVEFANPAALELLGYDHEEQLLGRISHPTIHHSHWDGTPFPEDQCPMLATRETGEIVRVDGDCFWRRDGSRFRVAYSSAPLPMAGGRGAIVVFRDITEQVKAERAARSEALERGRAQEIHASRARIVSAADAERRRLGRDLHDGAQQRLVRVLLAVRMAASQLSGESSAQARALLEEAAGEAEHAIVALRELAAGVHPQILTNRGLGVAVRSLSAAVPLPVAVDIPQRRHPPSIEAAVYFTVAEALTNVVKHAGASEAGVTVRADESLLRVEVVDDGCGGASVAAGSGMRGLGDRVAALGGALQVISPPGEGTTVRALLPLDGGL